MSSAVYTASTPAAAAGLVVSIAAMRAEACGLRTKVANAAPFSSGTRRLSTYVAGPDEKPAVLDACHAGPNEGHGGTVGRS